MLVTYTYNAKFVRLLHLLPSCTVSW